MKVKRVINSAAGATLAFFWPSESMCEQLHTHNHANAERKLNYPLNIALSCCYGYSRQKLYEL